MLVLNPDLSKFNQALAGNKINFGYYT